MIKAAMLAPGTRPLWSMGRRVSKAYADLLDRKFAFHVRLSEQFTPVVSQKVRTEMLRFNTGRLINQAYDDSLEIIRRLHA